MVFVKPKHSKIVDGYWYFCRRVPQQFMQYDRRRMVRLSTGIKVAHDPRGLVASNYILQLNQRMETKWHVLAEGENTSPEQRYDNARKFVGTLGFSYKTADEIAAGNIVDLLKRMETLANGAVDPMSVNQVMAMMGAVEKPQLMLSRLFEYYEKAKAVDTLPMSPNQKRKWRNPRLKALKNALESIGDKPISKISRDDALNYKDFWRDRILKGECLKATANTDIGNFTSMLAAYDEHERTDTYAPFSKIRFTGAKNNTRFAFSVEHVQNVLLARDTFKGINSQARAMFFLLADTGLRLSEACNLLPDQIHLKVPIPYIQIKPVGRVLKTDQSQRDIPLVGTALWIMQQFPNGFPKYRDRGASLSALLNKAISNRGLHEKDGQTLYSLRHTFEDRMSEAGFTDKMMAECMGHEYGRQKYGSGYSLDAKYEALQKIAFTPPDKF